MNEYIEVIKSAIIFFPLVTFFFTMPFILHNYHKYGSISFIKSLILYSFIFYLICAYFLIILPLPSFEEVALYTKEKVQLIPFHFVYEFIVKCHAENFITNFVRSYFLVPVFNIFLTIPFGIYIRYYFNTSLKKTVLWSFLLSLFFELTQLSGLYFIYPRSYRLFDVDDLMLNTLGGLIGYLISLNVLKIVPSVKEVNKKATIKGMNVVSGFRKFISICLDMFLVTSIWFILYLFFRNKVNNLYLIVFFIYIFIIPIFMKGRTFGERFLNIMVVSYDGKVCILRTLLRRVIFIFLYIGLLFLISYIFIGNFIYMSKRVKIFVALLIGLIIFMFYSITFIKYFFMNKLMLYERISRTKYISTIKGENINEKDNDC